MDAGGVARIVPIEVADDPRIAPYRDIRERDLVGREGHFIAEGAVVLRMLLASPHHRPVSLLIAEKRLPAVMPLLASLPADVPIYVAQQAVMDAIAGFSIHRGILALGRRADLPSPDALLAQAAANALVLVLFGIANHDNMGGIFRNAAAFGADAVLLDARSCDPLYRKAIRVSVGAALTLPFARLDAGADAIGLLKRHGFTPLALSPAGAMMVSQLPRLDRAALLLGAEGPGLAPDVLARSRTVRIPMAPGVDSLNVATTSGIVLHHLRHGATSP